MKKRVLFRGPALTNSGYGVHSRQVLDWLFTKSNIDLTVGALPWGITTWQIDGLKRDPSDIFHKITRASQPPSGPIDVSFQLQLPHEWDPNIAKVNIGITAGIESDKCSSEWIHAANKMSAIVVPSQHAANAFLNNEVALLVPIHVIPESYTDIHVKDIELSQVTTRFNFLCVSQITHPDPAIDRKWVYNMIGTFLKTFADNEDVGLILKVNMGRFTPIDKRIVMNSLSEVVTKFRQQYSNNKSKIYFLFGKMSDEEMYGLYTNERVHCLLAPTRGEGFGLPILEAAVSDLPIITTGWSAHTEFLIPNKYIPVKYKLTPIPSGRVDGKIWRSGSRWAEPDVSDLSQKMKKIVSMPVKPKQWAVEQGIVLREKYSQRSIRNIYDEKLGLYL